MTAKMRNKRRNPHHHKKNESYQEKEEKMKKWKSWNCHDCGVKEGEFHHPGCDMERCPFCGHQLISCDCRYHCLGLIDNKKFPETGGLPPDIYNKGLTEELEDEWLVILDKMGRIPYLLIPNKCGLCGEQWPEPFKVSDEEWEKYVLLELQGEMLCKECYKELKRIFPNGWRKGEEK